MNNPLIQNSKPSSLADEIRVQETIIRAHLEIHDRLEAITNSVLKLREERKKK